MRLNPIKNRIFCYNVDMKKSLATSNPYLRNQTLKKEMVQRFVASSSAIEGIHVKHPKKHVKSKKPVAKRRKA